MDQQASNQVDEYRAAAVKVNRALGEVDDLIAMKVVECTAQDDLHKVSIFLAVLYDKIMAEADRLSGKRPTA